MNVLLTHVLVASGRPRKSTGGGGGGVIIGGQRLLTYSNVTFGRFLIYIVNQKKQHKNQGVFALDAWVTLDPPLAMRFTYYNTHY